MKNLFNYILLGFATLLIAACSGGSSSSGDVGFSPPGNGGGGGQTLTSISITSNVASIKADGTETATITAVARDEANAVISGATINFSSDSGSLSVASVTTDANGNATAVLDTNNNAASRTIQVTASNGTISDSVDVDVVPVPASISTTTSVTTIASDGSETATITARAFDANNALLAGVPISFSATSGGLQGLNPAITDANGEAIVTLTTGGDSSIRPITVTSTTSNLSSTTTVSVVASGEVEVASLSLQTDRSQIGSSGSNTATITALVKDANNNFMQGVDVQFSPNSGGISVTQGTTDSAGKATAILDVAGNPANRRITVTATAGNIQETIDVLVTDTSLTISGQTNLSLDDNTTYTIILNDSSGNGIPGQEVTITSANGNSLSSQTVTTEADGSASVNLTATQSGEDTLTVSALGELGIIELLVSSDEFTFINPDPAPTAERLEVPLSTAQTISVSLFRDGVAVPNEPITFSTTRGSFTPASVPVITDSAGVANINIAATSAGPASITATTSTGLTTQVLIDFVALNPDSIEIQASPFTIPVNESSSILATVRDVDNNLVKNANITFTLEDITGGELSAGSAITDSQGRAQIFYTASETTSGKDAVRIIASIGPPVLAEGPPVTVEEEGELIGPTIQDDVRLTVSGAELFVSIGTGNSITEPNPAQYAKEFSVTVSDAGGVGVAGAQVSIQLLPALTFGVRSGFYDTGNTDDTVIGDPPQSVFAAGMSNLNATGYYKGFRQWNGNTWENLYTVTDPVINDDEALPFPIGSLSEQDFGTLDNPIIRTILTPFVDQTCENEDANFNGILDPDEDLNGNGLLDPGNIATVSPGSVITDATGNAFVTITYPQEYAFWLDVTLQAQLSVEGTEFSKSSTFMLDGAASDFNQLQNPPPGTTSPFGFSATCFDAN